MALVHEQIQFWTSDKLREIPGIVHGVTGRTGGISEKPYASLNLAFHTGDHPDTVITNRQKVTALFGGTLDDWVVGEQVHGNHVHRVTEEDRGRGAYSASGSIPATDGLFTAIPSITLAAFYADCVPIFIVDPAGPSISVVHAGWKGTLDRIAAAAVANMRRTFGTNPSRLVVAMGPCIGPCCYRVSEDMVNTFRERFPSVTAWHRVEDAWYLNLTKLNRAVLAETGVPLSRIDLSHICTTCHTDAYFSHRAEGYPAGRMAALIRIDKTGAGRSRLPHSETNM